MRKITLKDIRFVRNGRQVLDVPDLVIPASRITMVTGPSGAGKTTLLRIIAGLEKPAGGRVFFDDVDITDRKAGERGIGMVFQDGALFPGVKLYDNIAYGLYGQGMDRNEISRRVQEAAEILHIGELLGRKPEHISSGERQRAGIARAIVRNPQILLLDEPFSNLDQSLRDELRQEIVSLQKSYGMTMMFVTHDQREAFGTGDCIMVMKDGKVLHMDTADRTYKYPDDLFTATFFGRIQPFTASSAFGRKLLGERTGTAGIAADRIVTGSGDMTGTVVEPASLYDSRYMRVMTEDVTLLIPSLPDARTGDTVRFDAGDAVMIYGEDGRLMDPAEYDKIIY